MTIQSKPSFRSGINFVLSLILSYSIALIFCVPALADDECDKGEKAECFCECETIEADARGTGPCSLTEKENRWCSIAYNGNTGSLGEDSMGPKNVSTAFNPKNISSLSSINGFRTFPDHRSKDYARIVMDLTRKNPWWNPIERKRFAVSDDYKNIANQLIFIWLRASYVSARSISSQEISKLDRIVAIMLDDKYKVRKHFFLPGDKPDSLEIEDAKIFVRPGYIRIKYSQIKLRLIFRSAMER